MSSISVAADLAKYASTPTTSRRSRRRRHSVSVCETPPSGKGGGKGGRKKELSSVSSVSSAAGAAPSVVESTFEPISLPPIRGKLRKLFEQPYLMDSDLAMIFILVDHLVFIL